MRTEKKWKEKIEPKIIRKLFTPRIVKDFKQFNLEPIYNPNSLFIYGSKKASGKTILACRILLGFEFKAYLESLTTSTMFALFSEVLNEIRSAIVNNKNEFIVLEKYQNVDVLVLDDFGIFKISEWAYVTIYNLLNYRYEQCKITIFTSNNSIEELQEIWQDDRLTSRIARMCMVVKKEKL